MTTDPDEPVQILRRWQDSGAVWRVVRRTAEGLQIELVTCTGSEVAHTFYSADPTLLSFVGSRASSEES